MALPQTSGSRTALSTVAPTVTASSAYSAGNVVGGLLTFGNVPALGTLQSAHMKLASVQTAVFNLYLFDSNPTLSTITDKAAPVINAADVAKCIGFIQFSTALSDLGTHTIYQVDNIARAIASNSGTLYGVLVTKGTPTFTAISDILGISLLFK